MITLHKKSKTQPIKRDCENKCSAVFIAFNQADNAMSFVAMHKPDKAPAKWHEVVPYVNKDGNVRVYEVMNEYTDDFVYSNFSTAKLKG